MKKTLVVLLLLALTMSALPLKAEESIVNVGYYKAPNMSSKTISIGEYPSPVLRLNNLTLYASEDGEAYAYLAFLVSSPTANRITMYLSMLSNRLISSYSYKFDFYRNGTMTSNIFFQEFRPTVVGNDSLRYNLFSNSSTWIIKMALSYNFLNDLGVKKGENTSLAFSFKLLANNLTIASFPNSFNESNPATWGILTSNAFWGKVDISIPPDGLQVFPSDLKVNQTASIRVWFINNGEAPISQVNVSLYVNGKFYRNKVYSGVVGPKLSGNVEFSWRPETRTDYNITARALLVGCEYEKELSDNVRSIVITPKYITLKINGIDGTKVIANMNSSEIENGTAVFLLPYGKVTLDTENFLNLTSILYEFSGWRNETSLKVVNYKPYVFNLTRDTEITLEYNTYCRYFFVITDKSDQKKIIDATAYVQLQNNTIKGIRSESYAWLPVGKATIFNVTFSKVNVLPSNVTIDIKPTLQVTTYKLEADVKDIRIKVVDVFGMPIVGADVFVVLENGTSKEFHSDSSGEVLLLQIPHGSANITASYWISRENLNVVGGGNIKVTLFFSPLVLGVLFGLPIVILILAFMIIFKSKIFNRLAPKGKRVEETTL
ncbi:MAG: CARDB domain-containing protein [Thermoproteota archaeon]